MGILSDMTVAAIKYCMKLGSTESTYQFLKDVRFFSQINSRCFVRLMAAASISNSPCSSTATSQTAHFQTTFTPTPAPAQTQLSLVMVAAPTHLLARLLRHLAYLYSCAAPPIYHGNFKSINILILADENLNATERCVQLQCGVASTVDVAEGNRLQQGREDTNLMISVERMLEGNRLMETIDPVIKEGASQVELDSTKALVLLAGRTAHP
ncbi:hypothetical protein ACLOJK_012648 [Asimina triloba]